MDGQEIECFICDKKSVFYCKNILSLTSKCSSTPIYKFLEKFIKNEFELPNIDNEQVICQECLIKIEEYDLASTTAHKVEKELTELFFRKLTKQNNVENDIKVEEIELHSYEITETIMQNNKLESKEIILKCNICLEKFSSIADISSHSHCSAENFLEADVRTDDELEFIESESEIKDDYQLFIINENIENGKISAEGNPISDSIEKFQNKLKKNTAKVIYKCNICNKEYIARSEFRIHLKTHEKVSKFVCYICGMTYKYKPALDIHVALHSGVSPFECTECGKRFTQKGALQRHMPIHTGERPFQCEKCGKQFLHHSSFHMHKLAHDDIRDKKCQVCGLQLRSNSHLSRHMRVHSGEKPYSCPTCGQKFAQRYNMMTHFKGHQGIHRPTKSHTCVICQVNFKTKAKLDEHFITVHKNNVEIEMDNSSNLEEPIKHEQENGMETVLLWETTTSDLDPNVKCETVIE